MGECKTCMAPEAVNGVEKLDNKLALPNMVYHTDTGQAGFISIRGSKNCITSLMGNSGGGVTTIVKAPSGLGDGKSVPSGGRGTKSFTTQTGDTSRPTITALANPDGTGITIDSGAGRPPTMHMSTPDGLCSITMTSSNGGSITLRVGRTELVVNGATGMVEVTTLLLQEQPDHKDQLEQYRKVVQNILKEAMRPYSDSVGGSDSSGASSSSSGSSSSGSSGSSSSGGSGVAPGTISI